MTVQFDLPVIKVNRVTNYMFILDERYLMMKKSLLVNVLLISAICSGFMTSKCFAWKMADCPIVTKWGKDVTPDNAWKEYPRPAMKRDQWTNLNGLWDFAITGKNDDAPKAYDGKILVPFAVEAALSGVGKRVTENDAIWYKRTVDMNKDETKRYLLNFEAVDYQSTIWVNGKKAGENTGGNLPFSFDVTPLLVSGKNTISLKVTDATNTKGTYQLHGKQMQNPEGIWYTPVSGIWQTVWMEEVPKRYIKSLKITPKISGEVTIEVSSAGKPRRMSVVASLNGKEVASSQGSNGVFKLQIPSPKLWSPESPTLYDLEIKAGRDTVQSYVGLRETSFAPDSNGNLRFTLNGKPYFHWATLDQGWWPDGLLTPPSDAAMASDIIFLKAAGFNTIRKHIKVEPRRYYTYCDRIGMLMWQDQVSNCQDDNQPRWTFLNPNPATKTWPKEAHAQYMKELKLMIDTLYSHPCIVQWVPFNERWGQHQSMEVGKWVTEYDPTRQVNICSGGNWHPVGHIVDNHAYPHPGFPFELGKGGRFDGYVKVVGEFGGHGFPVEGHLWNPGMRNWGYGGLPKNQDEWKQRYATSINIMCGLKMRGIAGAVYTQTTDVEGEINGLLTYDRVEKIDVAWLRKLSDMLLKTPDDAKMTTVLPTTNEKTVTWKYTLTEPGRNWMTPGFNDSAWESAKAGFGTKGTPNTTVNTTWNTNNIWLRKSFNISEAIEGTVVLNIYHDEDAIVYLNGKEIADLAGYTSNYTSIILDDEAKAAFRAGENTIAIHCKQSEGGQFIDAGISILTSK